jgi:hypothetical protein
MFWVRSMRCQKAKIIPLLSSFSFHRHNKVKDNNTGQQNLTFFLSHEEKYLILIERLKLNSNM